MRSSEAEKKNSQLDLVGKGTVCASPSYFVLTCVSLLFERSICFRRMRRCVQPDCPPPTLFILIASSVFSQYGHAHAVITFKEVRKTCSCDVCLSYALIYLFGVKRISHTILATYSRVR